MRGYRPALVACLIATAAAIVLLSATGQDDSHITFWAARALARHGAITNYNGERIEQSSSLLLTVVLAGLSRVLPLAIPTLAYLVGIAACGLAAARVAAHTHGGQFLAALVVASSPLLGYWMLSGMETTLVAWLLVELALLGDAVIRGRARPFGLRAVAVVGALVAVRPEAVFVAVSALGDLTMFFLALRLRRGPIAGWSQVRRSLALLALTVGAFALLTAFRKLYFGAAFPNPVYAKGGALDKGVLLGGARYVWSQLSRHEMLPLLGGVALSSVLATIAFWRGREIAPGRLLALLLVLAEGSFIITVGGDWMAVGRFVAFAVPLLYLVLFHLFRDLRPSPRVSAAAGLAMVALNAAGLWKVATKEAPGRPLWVQLQSDPAIIANSKGFDFPWVDRANQTHTRDILFIGELSRAIDRIQPQKDPVVLMSGQAGMVMYYIASRHEGHVRFIDRHGLATRDLQRLKRDKKITGSATGLNVSVEQYFDLARRQPSLMPDIVFDLDPRRRAACVARGFRAVYEQQGQMSPNRPERPGPARGGAGADGPFTIRGWVYEFAAVRPELGSLFAERPVSFDWNAGP